MLESVYNEDKFVMWDSGTIFLYMSLIFISLILGYLAERNKTNKPLLLLFGILFCVAAIRDCGTDLEMYREIFTYSNTSFALYFGIEPGFLLVNRIIKIFTDNSDIAIVIWAGLSMYFVYYAIKRLHIRTGIAFAVFSFVAVYYFQSFNLLRIYLVAYFVCSRFYLLKQEQYKKFTLILLCCVLFHYSSIVLFLPFLSYMIYRRSSKMFWIFILGVAFILFSSTALLNSFGAIQRYSHYLDNNESTSIGTMQFIIHAPLFYLCHYLYKKGYAIQDYILLLSFTTSSFLFGLLSYNFIILGRVSIYFLVIFVVIIPPILNILKINRDPKYKIINIMLYGLIAFRCHMYLVQYLYLDGIMPYKTIF